MTNNKVNQRLRKEAIDIARKAGEILITHYGNLQALEYKLKTNFKTKVDDEVDRMIRQRLTEKFPSHTIYSEEQGPHYTKSEYAWIIDPLDGTIPYIFGTNDHFSVSIGLVKENQPVLGVIYAPKREEFYIGEFGMGASLNKRPIKVSEQTNLNKTRLGIDYGKKDRIEILIDLKKLLTDDGITYPFTFAGAVSTLGLVASGKLDGYLGLKLEPWDMTAAVVLCREAGAKVTTHEGKEWVFGDESILVANPILHQKLLKFLN